MIDSLRVSLYDQTLGYLAKNPIGGAIAFEYDPDFAARAKYEPAPVKMPVGERIYSFPELRNSSFRGLPGMIADALPDHYGTAVIEKYFLSRGENPANIGPLDMLAYIGTRAFGALEFHPHEKPADSAEVEIEIFSLWDQSRRILIPKNADELPSGMELVYRFGSTAGGARAKAAILFNPKSREFRVEGQTPVNVEGFSPWLIKFDGLAKDDELSPQPYERMEYIYSLIARDAGLNVPQTDYYQEENGMFHFLVKRFDRLQSNTTPFEKMHLQTLSAIEHSDHNLQHTLSYEIYLRIVQGLCNDVNQLREAYRRMVFNVFSHNFDDHSKNFAFLMSKEGEWSVSPAYDNVYTTLNHSWFAKGHQMTMQGKSLDITKQDLLEIAVLFDISKPEAIIDQTRSALSNWELYAKEYGLIDRFPEYVKEVSHGLRNLDRALT